MGIDPECLCNGIVSERINQNVLSTEVTQNVGRIEACLCAREKAVLRVSLAIAERNLIRVNLTAEIAF